MKKKVISLLLCLVMALSLIPTVASGADAGVTPTNVDIPVEKVWRGDENHSDQRPRSITVQLLDANDCRFVNDVLHNRKGSKDL